MSEIVKTCLLNDTKSTEPMDREEFYAEQIKADENMLGSYTRNKISGDNAEKPNTPRTLHSRLHASPNASQGEH